MRPHASALLISALFVMLAACGKAPEEKAKERALEAAESWLKLIDNKEYEQSWETASSYFRNVVPKLDWMQQVAAKREPLGAVGERKLEASEYRTEMPGVPDGEFVVLRFSTLFENQQAATETLTPTAEKDGSWRVSGYVLK